MSAPRTVVKMFKEQFAGKVKRGTKAQTIRPIPKRKQDIPRLGDRFSGRQWEGAPYRSKQIPLRDGVIIEVREVVICESIQDTPAAQEFARADGFKNLEAMKQWFREQYGLPFTGIFIRWKPKPQRAIQR